MGLGFRACLLTVRCVYCSSFRLALAEMGEANIGLKPIDAEEFRKHAHEMVDFIADYYRDIESFPVRSQVSPGYLKTLLPAAAPEDPETLEEVFADIQSKIIPGVTHWQSPNFFGYYPSNSSTAGLLGEMLSAGLNIVGFSWITSPAATELETIVLDWLAKLLKLPDEFLFGGNGGGVIQGTASEAVAVVLLAARTRAISENKRKGLSEAEILSKLAVYTSDQTHSCLQKGCVIAGIPLENLVTVPTDISTNYAVSPAAMRQALEDGVKQGLLPFFLCGTVGTTSSSAVDPLSALGDIAKDFGMWFHVDAAYAGSACICPEFRHHLDGVEKADSFNMNAHKWLLTNFDCSALWVKESSHLVSALSTTPEFLRNKASDLNQVVDYKDWQIPLGRRFRSLKLWFVMRMNGASGLRSYIRNHVCLAKRFEGFVREDPRFQLLVPRTFGLICFRLKPESDDPDNGRTLNSTLLEALNSSGRMFITHTVLSGVYTLRMAIGAPLTQDKHVDAAWKLIQEEATTLFEINLVKGPSHILANNLCSKNLNT
ncbi:tyrosine decarboxylase 1 isoform X2 [Selaginella moellendorffii]|uniref:tyrosine decarboxylase 1 isoform X2 n=1 Tax=Selaginella moellendorffii TaxID=88036 RepID=UPI000D1C678E|nr:tyrosine decarboxylase 1 isoform X2 [Selaginella moellendorffii]|eukprot:XP_024514926.1 tyrosine decarboxylase 1 isoform X2 [Selaginella moellendorffii]